jgi:hypothetical protein
VSRAGLEPGGPLDKAQVIDFIKRQKAQIAPSADLRYTAGTWATNSLVDSGGDNDRSCATRKTREPVPPGEHCHEIAAWRSDRI